MNETRVSKADFDALICDGLYEEAAELLQIYTQFGTPIIMTNQ